MATYEKKPWTIIAAVLAAIGASVCCVAPLLLLSLGVSGAWISSFSAFAPFRPSFIIITLIFTGLAYRKLYLTPTTCKKNINCTFPENQKKQKRIFWIVSILILLLLVFPWYAPYFME